MALKEIPCKSGTEFARVMIEGKILEVVVKDISAAGLDLHRVPALVATEVKRTARQKWCVRLAMSIVPGTSLESFLQAQQQRPKDDIDLAKESQERVAGACMCAGELLVQLAPIVEAFSASVYHRDITPRNIQIQKQDSRIAPMFGLVDFGLAVDASKWRTGEAGAGDLGGDGRYWPTSAWFVFCHGTRALKQDAWLCEEYRTHLDSHSLGLTALRCLVELLPSKGGSGSISRALRRLRDAWQHYWLHAQQFWQPIFDSFRGSGDLDVLRVRFTRAKIYRIISEDLCLLRTALCQVHQACASLPSASELACVPALCEALLRLVQGGLADAPRLVAAPKLSVSMPPSWLDREASLRQPSESTASPSSSRSSLASSGSSL